MSILSRRPVRIRLPDFSGKMLTLPDSVSAFEYLGGRGDVLILGIGPCKPEDLEFARSANNVYLLEAPEVSNNLSAQSALATLPGHWRIVDAEEAREMIAGSAVYFYRPGLNLAPGFWGKILGYVYSVNAGYKSSAKHCQNDKISFILPDSQNQLLHMELVTAISSAGYSEPLIIPENAEFGSFSDNLKKRQRSGQAILLSVNLRGLDQEGKIFYFCQAIGIPVCIWLVDMPWHLLSSLRLPWWQDAVIFVTDSSFVSDLRKAGGRYVFHLPLAVSDCMWKDLSPKCAVANPVFVGRSVFPDQQRFFAAARVEPEFVKEATELLTVSGSPGDGPNIHWWLKKLNVQPWPGHAVRSAGLGADILSRANRLRWVRAALPSKLELIGDAGWTKLLPEVRVLPPVDYYCGLPSVYHRSGCVLNTTSLLLPHSLNQRHFDVWAAGSILLTDATSGLEIFASDLTRPVLLEKPEDFCNRWDTLCASPATVLVELRNEWRDCLKNEHCYLHRLKRILTVLEEEKFLS